jgi:hypothetical protein
MITRHVVAGLALAMLLLSAGCCHPFCKRPAAVVSSSPICCPPGGAVPAEPAPVAPIPAPPPAQSFSVPPGTTVIR